MTKEDVMELDIEDIKREARVNVAFWREDYLDIEEEAWKTAIVELALKKSGVDIAELWKQYEAPNEWLEGEE
jgi:hypothetical protein